MLHETSSYSAQAWSMLNGSHRVTCQQLPVNHTFYIRKGRATPGNLHLQSPTADTTVY